MEICAKLHFGGSPNQGGQVRYGPLEGPYLLQDMFINCQVSQK